MPSEITITENDAGQRLDRFLRKAFKGTPLSLIHKAIRKGMVRVNGKKKKGDVFLSAGDLVTAGDDTFRRISTTHAPKKPSFDIVPLILYETPDYIFINKPAGITVHGGAGIGYKMTLLEVLSHYLKHDDKSLTFAPALAHRLDKETSGVIAAAKNAAALRYLNDLFKTRHIDKKYAAVIEGVIMPASGSIDFPLENKKGKMQHAQTRYRTIRSANGFSLLELTLLTGRTHQIRRHLAAYGNPVVGDILYNGAKAKKLMLHSHRLRFYSPQEKKEIMVEAPLPDYFNKIFEPANPA